MRADSADSPAHSRKTPLMVLGVAAVVAATVGNGYQRPAESGARRTCDGEHRQGADHDRSNQQFRSAEPDIGLGPDAVWAPPQAKYAAQTQRDGSDGADASVAGTGVSAGCGQVQDHEDRAYCPDGDGRHSAGARATGPASDACQGRPADHGAERPCAEGQVAPVRPPPMIPPSAAAISAAEALMSLSSFSVAESELRCDLSMPPGPGPVVPQAQALPLPPLRHPGTADAAGATRVPRPR